MNENRVLSTLVALTTTVFAVAGVAGCSTSSKSGMLQRPFAETSPWRKPIDSGRAIDAKSAEMIAYVQAKPGVFANLIEFGIPIYGVDSNTPSHTVECTESNYGLCPFAGWPVPIPDDAQPNSGSDHVLVTVDGSSGNVFEFWQAKKKDQQWETAFAAVNSVAGTGWGGAATGSGASRLAGVIRVAEIENGEIPHALALQSSNACATFRSPALKSDGTSDRHDCIPEGALLQLDPSLDLGTLGLSKGELAVATALQRYGGYLMDVAAAPMSMSFERDRDAESGQVGKVYREAGFRWDYDAMEHIPWQKLRVLS